jgi:hypothetical protein
VRRHAGLPPFTRVSPERAKYAGPGHHSGVTKPKTKIICAPRAPTSDVGISPRLSLRPSEQRRQSGTDRGFVRRAQPAAREKAFEIEFILTSGRWKPIWRCPQPGQQSRVPLLLTCFLFAGFFAVISGVLYGCYQYARIERGSMAIRAVIWCFVLVAVVAVSALATRVIWLIVHQTHQAQPAHPPQ